MAHGVSPAAARHRGGTTEQAHSPRPGRKTWDRICRVIVRHDDDERSVCQPAQVDLSRHRGRRNDVRMITRFASSSYSIRKNRQKWNRRRKKRKSGDGRWPLCRSPGIDQVASSFELENPEPAAGFGLTTRCSLGVGACGVRTSSRAIRSLPVVARGSRFEILRKKKTPSLTI